MNRLESHALAPWAILVLLVALSFSAFSLSLRDLMQIGINDPGKGYILLVPLVAAHQAASA